MIEINYSQLGENICEHVVAGPYSGTTTVPKFTQLHAAEELSQEWAVSRLLSSGSSPSGRQEKREIRIADFFCGPGGFTEGAKQACAALGFSCAPTLACDFSKTALGIYKRNHRPASHALANIRSAVGSARYITVDGLRILDIGSMELSRDFADGEGVDLFLAGPPCEGNSLLNNKTRFIDARNELYLFAVAIAIKLKAKAIAIENVISVMNSSQNVVERSLKMLEVHGYASKNATKVLTASDFLVPQSRSRHFLMSVKGQDEMPSLEVKCEHKKTLTSRQILGPLNALKLMDPELDKPAALSKESERRIGFLFENDLFDLPDSERPSCHRDKEHSYRAVYGRMYPDKPAPTLTTGFMTPGRGRFTHPFLQRSLTLREGAALQSFPISYKWKPPGGNIANKVGTSVIGDAVPPLLAKIVSLFLLAQI